MRVLKTLAAGGALRSSPLRYVISKTIGSAKNLATLASSGMLAASSVVATAAEADPTYFVKNGGDDEAAGTSDAAAWATAAKAVATATAGQSVGFKRGDTWREQLDPHVSGRSGSAGNPITFRAYGTGAKPKFLGSIDMGASGGWDDQGGNKWKWSTSSGSTEVCGLVFDDEASVAWRKTSGTMTTQGDFYWSGGYTYLYSASNPGTYYDNIEAVKYITGVQLGTLDYITVKDIDVRYWGRHGFLTYDPNTNIIIEDNDVSFIGPGTAGLPLGNGVELQGSTSAIIRNNHFSQVYDSAITTIDEIPGPVSFYGNVASFCENGYEIQSVPTGMLESDIAVYGNVFYKSGYGVWHDQRPDPRGKAFESWSGSVRSEGCSFTDNIGYLDQSQHIRIPTEGWTANGNRWYPDGTLFYIYSSDANNFAAWQAHGYDATGSIIDEVAGDDATVLAALEAML